MLYWGNVPATDISPGEIASFCNACNIPVHIEDKKEELYLWKLLHEPDIIFVVGYSYKINIEKLGGVPKGVYNIHFGKLPEFRGPSPVFWQLKKGCTEIGLTIHELSDKFDSGAIVWEYLLKNDDHLNYNYVSQVFSELQVRGVIDLLEKFCKNEPLKKLIQSENKAAYYKKPQLKDVMVNWAQMDAREIVNLVKACNSWNNGAGSLVNGIELKLLDANIGTQTQNGTTGEPGTITVADNKFLDNCINRGLLSINFFNINNTYIPARHAYAYGLKTGQKFMNI